MEVNVFVTKSIMPQSSGLKVRGLRLDQIEPSLELTPTVQLAFTECSQQVEIFGPEHTGFFVLDNDCTTFFWSDLDRAPVIQRVWRYRFLGWSKAN